MTVVSPKDYLISVNTIAPEVTKNVTANWKLEATFSHTELLTLGTIYLLPSSVLHQ